jgi:hypothetical protein
MRHYIIFATLVTCIVTAVTDSRAGDEMPKDVSMVQLLATPEKFNGKLGRVFGFLRLAFEGGALCLYRGDDTQSLTRNAVWLVRFASSRSRTPAVLFFQR